MKSNWDNLRYFNALAQHGTLSRAARELGVSHSTVQRHISAFEAELQTRLFLQGSNGYKLSHSGQKLYRETAAIKQTLNNISSEISGADEALSGRVSITVSDTIGHFLLPDLIKRLQARHPLIEVSISVINRLSDIQDLEVDIAVRSSARPEENLIGRQIGSIEFCICAAKEYVEKQGMSASRPVHEAEHFIQLDESFENSTLHQWLPHNRRDCRIIRVNGFLAAYRLCTAGLGVTLLPRYILNFDKNLVLIESAQLPENNPLWVLSHAELRDSERVKVVRQFLAESLSEIFS